MIKPLRKLSFLILLLLPFIGYCQLPVPKWVDHFGGSGDSKATGMVVDKQSNVYVGGYFAGTVDFDPSAAGVKNLTSKGGYDIYIAKYKPDGTLIWAESFGGGLLDQMNSLGIDANGNPTLIGQFQSSDLVVGATTLQTVGNDDIFIIHLNTNGGVLWAKSIGGPDIDRGEQVNADAQGNIIATAIFQSTVTVDGNTLTATGGFHGLIAKYDASGNLIWDINLGSNSGDTEVFGNGIDSNGNILISGSYTGQVDFDPLGAHKNSTSNGANMPFLAKYTSAGKLIWINFLGGNLVSNQTELSVDANNDIVLAGSFSSNLTFNGATTLTAAGQDDFVAKYTANGSFIFAKDLKTTGAGIFNYQVKTDAVNNIYMAGYFSGTVDFDPSTATATVSDHGSRDFYLAKYDKNGNYVWGFGGGAACGSNLGNELAVFGNDDVLLAGSFCSTVDFAPSTCATDNITAINGTSDSFVAHYVAGAAAGQITGFTLPQQTAPAIINQANFTITISVSPGTSLTALVPTITSSNNGTLSPASGVAHDFTNPVVYTLDPGCNQKVYTVTVLSANQVLICPGSTAKLIGHTPTPAGTFAWQVLQAGTWVNAPGVINGKDYQTATFANNTASPITYSFRRQVTSGVVTYDSFNDVIVQPAKTITNNTIAASGSTVFCAGDSPAGINGSAPAGGTGAFTYQWQISADNASFTDITGAKARDYTPGTINATTYYRRKVTSGACITPTMSNVVTLTVLPIVKNNAISAPPLVTFCATGDPANIVGSLPAGGSGSYVYQWQKSTDNINFVNINGANAKDYNPGVITVKTYYRRNVTSGACSTPLVSNVVIITVLPSISNNTITAPAIASFCVTGNAANITGSTPTGGNGAYIYKWQTSIDNVNFTDIVGATAINYDPPAVTKTTYIRRTITSGLCTTPSVSNVVTISVLPHVANNVITTPAVTIFCATGDPTVITGSSPTGGNSTYNYQWQQSADNVTFASINGATAKNFDPAVLTATTYYRRVVTSGACTTPLISDVVKITITPALKSNTIVSPLTTTFCTSVDPALIIGSSPTGGNGSGTYLYQWQQSTNNGTTWTNITGATSINYNPPLITVTTAFRRNVTSGVCALPAPSNTVTFIILSPPATVKVNAPAICAGNKATLTVTSPNNTLTYIWYDNPGKTKVIFTGQVFTTPVLQSNQSYYVEANNGGCSSPALTKVPVTVNTLPTVPLFQKTPVAVCTGSQATISIASPGAGITYTWYSAAIGGTALFTGTVFTTPAIINATTYYVEAANSTGCVSPTRAKADIVASPLPQVTVQGASVCPGSPATLVSNNADPGVTVNWYTAQTGGSSIFTGNSFTTPPINANTTYYAEAISNTCVSATRTAALAQIILPLAAPVVQVLSEKAPDVVFQWGAVAGATGYQVSTDNGVTFTAPTSGTNGTTHMVTGLTAGQTVSIIVRATGPSECQQSNNSAVVMATVTSPLTDEIYIANAFTPNGDGKNDVVYVHSENIKSLKFYIYSQWGELLFTSLNQQNGWDGTYKGQKEPVGVYVYYFEAIMNDGQQVNKKGTVTLLR